MRLRRVNGIVAIIPSSGNRRGSVGKPAGCCRENGAGLSGNGAASVANWDAFQGRGGMGTSQGLASRTKLNGVAVARRKREKPPARTTSRSRASPAWAPRANPTSWLRDAGTQIIVEAA